MSWQESLRSRHEGEHAFVIGNGPSLRVDIDELLANS